MNKYQGVFERYEKKYLLDENKYNLLVKNIREQIKKDEYFKSNICSVYFDTSDYRLIRASLEKPVYKEKLRIRSYNTPGAGDPVFVELKKKYNGVVFKRRVDMTLKEAENYLYYIRSLNASNQIEKEINWVLGQYPGIGPSMYISYDRLAYCGAEDPSLRITFDSHVLWRQDALHLDQGSWGNPLLDPGQRIMEIKALGAMPVWLSHILNEMQIYPTSYSKYGKAYLSALSGGFNRKGGRICA